MSDRSEAQAQKKLDEIQRGLQAEQRLLAIERRLEPRFFCTYKRRQFGRLPGFQLAVRLKKPPKYEGGMVLLKIVRAYSTEYLAACDVDREVEVIVSDDWPT